MFLAKKRYSVISYNEFKLEASPYWRSLIVILDSIYGKEFSGAAEGDRRPLARLRALAEAYEKLCFNEFISLNGDSFDRQKPYGFGVGLRRRSAQLRAYGEYYERLKMSAPEVGKQVQPGQVVQEAVATNLGKVFVCLKKAEDGRIGTGYGLSPLEARDSAERSAHRKISYPGALPHFSKPNSSIIEVRLTPKQDPWLECYIIAHGFNPEPGLPKS